jgi:hypothetical protein
MKIFAFLTISILLLSACEKEDLAPKLRRETADKMMGKWMVQRTIDQVYDPLPTLSSTIEVLGTANDYFDFQANELVEIKTSYSARLEDYRVWNPSQVMVGEVVWWIEKLTATELVLKLDRNDAVQYRRYVTRIYLSRT